MRKLHARERYGGRAKGLQGKHWSAATFDCPMILLDDVVEVSATAYHDGTPLGIFLPQLAQCPVSGRVAVELQLTGPPGLVGLQRLTKESSGG
jgi:hypothetical protein